MKDCIFCKIIAGELPSEKVYENDKVMAFLDINWVKKGDTLVIPKKHYASFYDASDSELSELIKATRKVSEAVEKAVSADGINIIINDKPAAGQVIMHLHIHIIPRFKDDGIRHWPVRRASPEELKQMQKSVISFI